MISHNKECCCYCNTTEESNYNSNTPKKIIAQYKLPPWPRLEVMVFDRIEDVVVRGIHVDGSRGVF
jgi:hypothetical protein